MHDQKRSLACGVLKIGFDRNFDIGLVAAKAEVETA